MDSDTPATGRTRRHLEHLADSMPQLVWMSGSDGTVDYYNSRLSLYGGAEPRADGTWEWGPMVHEDDLAFTVATWERAVASVTTFSCEHRIRMADGEYRWHLSRAEPVADPDSGEIRWYGTATDVHEQKVAEERLQAAVQQLQRLQGVTAALSAPLWSEADVVEALLGEGLLAAGAEGGAVLVVDAGGVESLGAAYAPDVVPSGPHLVAALTGERAVVSAAADGGVQAIVPFPPALRVPGGLALRYPPGTELGSSQLAALRTVAELGAQALLRARAYQDEQRRADQAEALQALATALATSGTVEEVARAIARYAGRSAGTDFAIVGIPTDDRTRLRLVHAPGLDAEVAAVWSEVPVDDATPLTDAFREGRTVVVGDEDRDERYPVTAGVTRRVGFTVTATLPARAQDGTIIGAIGFGWRRAVTVGAEVLASLDTVVSLCAQAMHRAALFEAEQQRRNYTERVRNAVSALARALTVEEVAVAIVRRAALSLGATTAALFDVAGERVDLRVADGDQGLVQRWVGELAAPDGAVAGACRTGEIAVDSRTILLPLEGTRGSGTVVVLGFPAHTAWGTYRDRLTSLAAQWSQAFERARLHDTEQAEHRRTEQLQELTARLAGCARTAHVLEVVQVHLPAAFGLSAARLLLGRRSRRDAPDTDGAVVVPLSATDPEGDLLVVEPGEPLGPDQRRAVEAFAVQCAQTLGRTRSQEREHEIATQLQHALLGDVDRIPGLAVGTVYLASEAGLDIGGDWYDVIRRDDDTAVLVIGDVVGHSLSAATAMGQLRSAVRALAHLCDDPQTLLERVVAYSENVREARYSTLALVHLDVPTGRFRYVCAGHPPLLLVDGEGTCTFLEEGRNPPLAAFPTAETRAGSATIPEGGLLVLYTDGLIEHRGRSLDEGLEQMCEIATPLRELPPELFASHLTDEVFARVEARDDVAVLAVAPLTAPHLDVVFAASPSRLAGVRQQMRAWLHEQGASDEEVGDVLLLAGESIANAVEHAYHGRAPGLVEVRLECVSQGFRLTVSDEGGWRTPHAPGKRGRGTSIMRSLADELIVSRSPGQQGTTLFARVGRRVSAGGGRSAPA